MTLRRFPSRVRLCLRGEYSHLLPPDQQTVGSRNPAMASQRPSTPGRGYRGVPEIDAQSFNPLVPSGNVSR